MIVSLPALRVSALIAALALLAGCAGHADLEEDTPEPIGDFRLSHNIVVADNVRRGPLSRAASPQEWQEVLVEAIDERLGRYDGGALYHLAVNVDGYVLAVPGVPVVASPRSVLIIRVNVWDDAAGAIINDDPRQMTIFEDLSGGTLISSGLTQSRDEQMHNLARNAARAIQRWLEANRDWFGAAPLPAARAEAILAELDADIDLDDAPPPDPQRDRRRTGGAPGR